MTKKLNVSNLYHTYAYKPYPGMYYVSTSSVRGMCFSCKYNSSCPYSYMKIYRERQNYIIKCMRYVPYEYTEIRSVGLYFNENTRMFNKCLINGWKYD